MCCPGEVEVKVEKLTPLTAEVPCNKVEQFATGENDGWKTSDYSFLLGFGNFSGGELLNFRWGRGF